jgi:hypothetical protein
MFKPTLKKILSSFEKTIAQLEGLEASNLAAVSQNEQEIVKIQAESTELSSEAAQAKRVAEKLKTILS